jgi:hypothetical protein
LLTITDKSATKVVKTTKAAAEASAKEDNMAEEELKLAKEVKQ